MLTNEQLQETVDAVNRAGGNKAQAARDLGMLVETLKARYKAAIKRNLTGLAYGGVVPDGYELGKVTQLHTSEDGKTIEWRHLNPTKQQQSLEDLTAMLEAQVGPIPVTHQQPPTGDILRVGYDMDQLATVYPIPDFHFGQYSWGKETGEAYDLDVAKTTLEQTFRALVNNAAPTHTAVVLGLGDFFHADGNDARTPKSQNALDVDSRYGKVQWMGAEAIIWAVDQALLKHEKIIVRVLPGNHDPHADMLTIALWFRYMNNPRVNVDRNPGLFWFWTWGKTMVAAHHGHEAKAESMPGLMAAYEPEMWGNTEFRYAYLGHYHKRSKGIQDERGGAIWEIFQAITAKDAWNRGKGHASGRSIAAITLDKTKGEVFRHYEPILLRRK